MTIPMCIATILLFCVMSYGDTDTAVSVTPSNADDRSQIPDIKEDTIVREHSPDFQDWTTIALVLFTAILAGATIYYAIQTGKYVKVSRELVSSNKQLIELSKSQNEILRAQGDIDKAQLLAKIHDLAISTRDKGEASLFERDLEYVIRIYLSKSAGELLGKLYKDFVLVKLIRPGDQKGESIFHMHVYTHQSVIIPRTLWEEYEAQHSSDHGFEDFVVRPVLREDLSKSAFFEQFPKEQKEVIQNEEKTD